METATIPLARCFFVMTVLGMTGAVSSLRAEDPLPPAITGNAPISAASSKPGRSLSTSRQFVVHGDTLKLRGAFASYAESVKEDYLKLMTETGRGRSFSKDSEWKFPIVIQVRSEDMVGGSGVRSRITRAGDGFRIQVDVEVSSDFDKTVFRRELLRALLAEQILRARPTANLGGRTEILPNWLFVGVAEAIAYRKGGRPSSRFAKAFERGRVLSVDQILQADPEALDSVSRAVYDLSACGLMHTLLEQRGGATRLRALISDLAGTNESHRALLLRHFPSLRATKNSLEKWWALQVASMAKPNGYELISAVDTEQKLREVLFFSFDEPVGKAAAEPPKPKKKKRGILRIFGLGKKNAAAVPPVETTEQPVEMTKVVCEISEVDKYMDRPDRKLLLSGVAKRLMVLGYRAHPLFRSIIGDYRELVEDLAEGNSSGLEKRLGDLAVERDSSLARDREVSDHLNWFEATQSTTKSGAFEDYKRAVQKMDQQRPNRKDALTRYLDALEEEFGR